MTFGAACLGHKEPTCHHLLKSCQVASSDIESFPMPVLSAPSAIQWEDPDFVPRPVVTLGAAGLDVAAIGEDGTHPVESRKEADFHHHRKGQFLLWMRGVLTCEVAGGFWLVPPGSGIWVPGGVTHRMETAGTVECYVVYVDPEVGAALPRDCCTLSTTPAAARAGDAFRGFAHALRGSRHGAPIDGAASR